MSKKKTNERQLVDVFVGTTKMYNSGYGAEPFPTVVNRVSLDADYVSLDSVFEQLVSMKAEYSNDYQNLYFESIEDCGCYGPCSCRPRLYLKGKRLENDLEYNYRIKMENQRRDDQEARERAEYEKLKAKYDDKNG